MVLEATTTYFINELSTNQPNCLLTVEKKLIVASLKNMIVIWAIATAVAAIVISIKTWTILAHLIYF